MASDAKEILNRTTAVILAGGRGTRISAIYPDIPKPLVPASGRPFVHWVASWLKRQGLSDIVLSIGHMAQAIEEWAASEGSVQFGLTCRREDRALGTGGGVLNCLDLCRDFVLVTNGDSLVAAELAPYLPLLEEQEWDALIFGVEVEDAARYGSLTARSDGALLSFSEKNPGRGLVNAGVYVFRKTVFQDFPTGTALSMEMDIMPALVARGRRICVISWSTSEFLDIGTPDSVHSASDFIARNLRVFGS